MRVHWRIDKAIHRVKIRLDEPRDYKADAFRSVKFEDSLKLYTSIMD